MRRLLRATGIAILIRLGVASCGGETSSPHDAGTDSAQQGVDAGADGAPGDAGEGPYHDITSPSFWSTFDTTTINTSAHGFRGVAFDGRYVYFVPNNVGDSVNPVPDGVVTRYDTQATFGASASWSTFDTTTVSGKAKGFLGAVFDGRYIYFAPNNDGAQDGVVTRYDTQADFTALGSWATFDATTVTASAMGFGGATFDGRYVYFVPGANDSAPDGGVSEDGVVTRYDTQASFTATASWSTFDTTTVMTNAKGFIGAVFDGRYVYFVPFDNGPGADGIVARYDTQASFAAVASWSTFDTATLNANDIGFIGGAFDGRYLYLVPLGPAVITRYDTTAAFTATASWSTFDTTTVNANAREYAGAAFDGRYLYFVPLIFHMVTRYDTQASFGTSASWSTFDTASAGAYSFFGAAFDGRYVYFAPYAGGAVARFDAKTPPSMPTLPAWHGSFF